MYNEPTVHIPVEGEPKTIEEFVMYVHAPEAGDPFYKAWGYSQWLIKTFSKDFEQLCILSRGTFQKYLLSKALQGFDSVEAALQGKPMVRATHIIRRFLQADVPVGGIGFVFERKDDQALVWFPRGNTMFPSIFDWVRHDQIEDTGATFVNEDQAKALAYWDTVTSGYQCAERYITGLSGRVDQGKSVDPDTVYYVVSNYSGSIGYADYHFVVVPAEKLKNGKWKKVAKHPVKDTLIEVWGIGDAELERIRVVG